MKNKRRLEEFLVTVLMRLATFIVVGSLLIVLGIVVAKGIPALTLSMITQSSSGGFYMGGGGGILNAIVGSMYLVAASITLAFLIGLPVALYLNEYAGRSKMADFVRLCLDVLYGVPSIVYGAFAFTLMLLIGARASLLWGIITVTLLVIPIMIRGIDEVIRTVPSRVREASYSLGATRLETAFKVITRQVLPGIVTTVLLALGRGIGDAASVLLTAGYSDSIPTSLNSPVATLPLAIFFQLGTPYPQAQERAYASAIILLGLIVMLSVATRVSTGRFSKFVIK
ncbi:MAG TPA: phosphate ABC transporter permease PstA [Candidatus Saccharimonadales bacterium]|nr:phosphate ABC transporter permease PstA [Candidatus Saccharimonadales bacterium]